MTQNRTEKREYVRVGLAGRVMVKPVSREEYERNRGIPDGAAVGRIQDSDDAGALLGGALEDRLMRIEEKLDRILQKLELEAAMEGPVIRGMTRNISGAGVNMALESSLEAGQLVLMSLTLPGFSIGMLHAYGKVVRVTQGKEKGAPFSTSVKFLALDEKARDMLISYSFYRQRQEIRQTGNG